MVSSCSDPVIQKKKKRRLGIFMTQKDQKGSMCSRARAYVHVFDFCHDSTKYLHDLHQSDVH